MSDPTNEWLAGIRAVHFAATLSTTGTVVFWFLLADPVFRKADAVVRPALAGFQCTLARIIWASLLTAIVTGVIWIALLAAQFGDRPLVEAFTTDLVPTVIVNTRFGSLSLLRLALCLLLVAALSIPVRDRLSSRAPMLAAVPFSGSLAWTGHGGATEGALGNVHLVSDALHVCAAAAWLGGLLPLAVLLRAARRTGDETWIDVVRDTTRRFSVLGVVSVGTLLATGAINTWLLAGTVPALVGTTYGKLLLVKITLFAAMLSLAAVNRLRVTPKLFDAAESLASRRAQALRTLERNSLTELALGVIIVFIVGFLGTMPPALHAQPWWPFSFRLDGAIFDHPTLLYRTKAIFAVTASLAGIALLVAAIFVRMARLPFLLLGVLGASFIPQCLRLLSVDAFPTSFYGSPTGYTVASVERGRKLFAEHCTGCHGPDGRGEVRQPKGGSRPPDLTGDHIYAHRVGDLFWWITNGIGEAMPGFAASIDEEERWNLIDFVHANADAAHVRSFGADDLLSVSIPNFACETPTGSTVSTSQLRGRIIYILFARSPPTDLIRELAGLDLGHGATKILVTLDDPALPDTTNLCIARDPAIAAVFAGYRGGDLGQLDGSGLVVDAAGFLRAMQRPQSSPAPALIREVRDRPALPRATSARLHSH